MGIQFALEPTLPLRSVVPAVPLLCGPGTGTIARLFEVKDFSALNGVEFNHLTQSLLHNWAEVS